jgi:DNA repair protein RecO (recombination protein O)
VEVASKCVKEHEENEPLYDFMHDFLLDLDTMTEGPEYQPLRFLWRMSAILGFEPSADAGEGNYFNVQAGHFEALPSATEQTLSLADSAVFKKFLLEGQDIFTGRERKILLDAWLWYFQWHVPDFGILRSPKILHEVLK